MRGLRILVDGAFYYVTTEANRDEYIFDDKKVKNIYITVLEEAVTRFSFKIKNFNILRNKIELIIKPLGKNSLSDIMKWINQVFAVRFNKYKGYRGHVWRDRFKSTVIKNLKHMLTIFKNLIKSPIIEKLIGKDKIYRFSGLYYLFKNDFTIVEPPDLIIDYMFEEKI